MYAAQEATACKLYIWKSQQSSLKTMARRVLVLAATAAALRPTLPRRTRTAPRAALTMHDYDYDVARCVEINSNALMGLTD